MISLTNKFNRWLLWLLHFWILGGTIVHSPKYSRSEPLKPIADNTLGTTVNPNNNVDGHGNSGYLIEGGSRNKNSPNLFHSFEKFDVDNGQRVYFANVDGVTRIFSRVTGNSSSKILGTLGVQNNADLFIINPNGILFGKNASLDIKGSFIATTANSILFTDKQQFSATDTATSPLLIIGIPIGLQFRSEPGSITIQTRKEETQSIAISDVEPSVNVTVITGLSLLPGKTLALIGGDIISEGALLKAPQGHIEIGSVETGEVKLDTVATGWSFNYDNVQQFNNIGLTQATIISTNGTGSDGIQIQGKNLSISDGSRIFSAVDLFDVGEQPGGNITITTSDTIKISGQSSGVFTTTFSNSNAGNINIKTQRLLLQQAGMSTESIFIPDLELRAAGKPGKLTINTSEAVKLDNNAFLNTRTVDGDAGALQITTRQLTLQNGSQINSSPSLGSQGRAGDIIIKTEELTLNGNSQIAADSFGLGNGGDIILKISDRLQLRNSSQISTNASRTGNGGNITINTKFLLAFPSLKTPGSNDITANASEGEGGAINIRSQGGVYGLQIQEQFSADSNLNAINEISALSQFKPNVRQNITLITPNVDPSRGLIQFPTTIINPDTLIAQNPCNKQDESGLAITERGGLPVNILEDISPRAVEVELIAPVQGRHRKIKEQNLHPQKPEKIIPARGWIREKNGRILLTAYDPTLNNPQRQPQNPATCPTL